MERIKTLVLQYLIPIFSYFLFIHVSAQSLVNNHPDSLSPSVNTESMPYFTLEQCLEYALKNQPGLHQASINQDITRLSNSIALSGWLPQVSASGNLEHYIQLPSSPSPSGQGSSGTATNVSKSISYSNYFLPQVSITQAIFTPSLLYALRVAPLFNTQSRQITDSTKIYLVSAVSKSFYNLLLTLEQIDVYREDTARLGKSYRDAYYQYKGGIVDETNYEQALILLNNSKAQLRQALELVKPNYASLKQLMGYSGNQDFNVRFDTTQMVKAIYIDTTQVLNFEKRIEYQQIKNNFKIQSELIKYYRREFLPTLGAFYNYNLSFENNEFSSLFSKSYPNSIIGLSVSVPIFTGFSRVRNLEKSRLQQKLIEETETNIKLQVSREYQSSLGAYKSNLYNLKIQENNIALSKRVYFVTNLQYKQGIVPYLNVITAESNLITSKINYLNTLFQVLSSKIDFEKAMGILSY